MGIVVAVGKTCRDYLLGFDSFCLSVRVYGASESQGKLNYHRLQNLLSAHVVTYTYSYINFHYFHTHPSSIFRS